MPRKISSCETWRIYTENPSVPQDMYHEWKRRHELNVEHQKKEGGVVRVCGWRMNSFDELLSASDFKEYLEVYLAIARI